ncbi:unnamed protein product [Mytilus edulis]|uniref:SET domain-containing protein n=1 Tax=Mytilus edulis TaxID=6550 RepID=A0A8S3RNX1_MYTED|nr:unnamed protein product [Mytilus edulis]
MYLQTQAKVFMTENMSKDVITKAGEEAMVTLYGGNSLERLHLLRWRKFTAKTMSARLVVSVQFQASHASSTDVRLCLFAIKDIGEGEEISYDYGDDSSQMEWRSMKENTESSHENAVSDGRNLRRMFNGSTKCIDATNTDRLCRFVNDESRLSKHCNAKMKIHRLSSTDVRLCLFAIKDIGEGEEISYDYGDDSSQMEWRSMKENTESSHENAVSDGTKSWSLDELRQHLFNEISILEAGQRVNLESDETLHSTIYLAKTDTKKTSITITESHREVR